MTTPTPPTVGVEEEFLLLHPHSGDVTPVAHAVIERAATPYRVTSEIMRFMVETRTPVCTTLDDVRASLQDARLRVARAARAHGATVVAVAVPPRGFPAAPPVTHEPRYAELLRLFPEQTRVSGTCSCHVHVGVADRQTGLRIVHAIRPWLPVLLALTAASPVWNGQDSGWASRRFPLVATWPTARPPPRVRTVAEYDARVRAAVASGLALDARSVYYLVRLSPRHQTVELRVADTFLTAEQAVAWAGLVRALAAVAVDGSRRLATDRQEPDVALLRACALAARNGLDGHLPRPGSGASVPTVALVTELLDLARPVLTSWGEEEVVVPALERIVADGGGAAVHRRVLRATGDPGAYVRALARLTCPGSP